MRITFQSVLKSPQSHLIWSNSLTRKVLQAIFLKPYVKMDMKFHIASKLFLLKKASTEISDYLKTRVGSAILGVTQTSYLADGRAFEYVLSQYVGERFEFYLER